MQGKGYRFAMTLEERIAEAKKLNNEATIKMLNLAKEYGTDLIEVSVHGSPCKECAKYQGRIYSISGKDRRFPKYPDWLLYNACPYNCGLMSYPFVEGFSEPSYINGDIIAVSNRPFEDDRTPEQIAIFEERKNRELIEQQHRNEYEQLKKVDIAPKNLASYSRMKNSNSKGYIKLKEKAEEYGIKI